MSALSSDFEDRFAELVAYRTVGRTDVDRLLERVADWADRPDIRARRLGSSNGTFNLYLEMGPEPSESAANVRGLVLCGHVDVVPADEEGWRSAPFELVDENDRWIARGSADMKGFVALALDRFLARRGAGLSSPLGLLLTYDEEVGSVGAQRIVDEGPPPMPGNVLIGEPTGLEVFSVHKGHLRLRLDFVGEAAHSGHPQQGRSAIEPAAEAIRALVALRRELSGERLPSSRFFPETPYPALNVGVVRGGAAVNVVADACRVELGIRTLPGMDAEPLVERVEDAVRQAVGEAGWTLTVDNESPPLETAESAPLVSALHRVAEQQEVRAAAFSTDGGTLARLGLQPVVWGPGSIEVAHKPNEFLPKDETFAAAATVDRLIDRFCGTAP